MMTEAAINFPPPASLAEQAYRILEEKLVTLQFSPGEMIGEKTLVDELGIGRTPVREAIQRLSAEGLLEVLPRKGLLVTPIRRKDLARIIEVRRVLERLMVVKAAERAQPRQRLALKFLSNNLQDANTELERFFQLDRELNELLAIACDNRFLVGALAVTHGQCRRLWFMHKEQLDLPASATLHSGLAMAVADGHAAGAIRASDKIVAILEELVDGLDVLS